MVKDFGKIESLKKSVKIVDGKYGLYIKAGTKNYAMPDEWKKDEVVKKLKEAEVVKFIKENSK